MTRALFLTCAALCLAVAAQAEPMHPIVIDGQFDDWASVPVYNDPPGNTHDTDHTLPDDVPVFFEHPDVDLLEYKFSHDTENLYAYFKANGSIGRTQNASLGRAGRYYVIVTIDVDNDDVTGYWINEGGYFPTSPGYDVNMEVEFYDGTFNTGNYLNHGCLTDADYLAAQIDQSNGVVDVVPGIYDIYTQWVFWDQPQGIPGEITLPDGHSTILWVEDKGPVYESIIQIALSPDGHEAEMVAPFRGFMKNKKTGEPIIALGNTIDISFSLEASGELTPSGEWASNTALPINGYYLSDQWDGAEGEGEVVTEGEITDEGEIPSTDEGENQILEGEGTIGIPDSIIAAYVETLRKGMLASFTLLDTNLDGELTIDEARVVYAALRQQEFDRLDKDGDGVLTFTELGGIPTDNIGCFNISSFIPTSSKSAGDGSSLAFCTLTFFVLRRRKGNR